MKNCNLVKVIEYIAKSRFLILTTERTKDLPELITLLSFANDGFQVYFSTGSFTKKVQKMAANSTVKLSFQHDGQELCPFQSISFLGNAVPLETGSSEYQKAMDLISLRNPSFKSEAEKGQLRGNTLFKVIPQKSKLLNFPKR